MAFHSHRHPTAGNRVVAINAYRYHVLGYRLGEPFKKQPRIAQSAQKTRTRHHLPDRACNIGKIGRCGNRGDEVTHGTAFALLRGWKTVNQRKATLEKPGWDYESSPWIIAIYLPHYPYDAKTRPSGQAPSRLFSITQGGPPSRRRRGDNGHTHAIRLACGKTAIYALIRVLL